MRFRNPLSPFSQKEFFSKTFPSFLTLKEGSTSHLGILPSGKKRKTALQCYICPTCPSPAGGSLTHSQALALSKRARDVTSMLLRRFFPTTPSLLHKEGSTAFPKPFSPQGTRDVTAPPVALNRCALRLAGHQSPRQVFYAGMGAQGAIADFQVHPLLRLSGFEGLWLHSP